MAEEPGLEPGPSTGHGLKKAAAIGAGAIIGGTLLAVGAPVVLPVVGLGALVGAATPLVGATVGSLLGWHWSK